MSPIYNVTVRMHWQAAARPAGFIRAVNGAFVDDACKEFFPVGWNSCAHPHTSSPLPSSLRLLLQQALCTSQLPAPDQRHEGNPNMSHWQILLTLCTARQGMIKRQKQAVVILLF